MVGSLVGSPVVGDPVGLSVGNPVGLSVGDPVGLSVGKPVGLPVRAALVGGFVGGSVLRIIYCPNPK